MSTDEPYPENIEKKTYDNPRAGGVFLLILAFFSIFLAIYDPYLLFLSGLLAIAGAILIGTSNIAYELSEKNKLSKKKM